MVGLDINLIDSKNSICIWLYGPAIVMWLEKYGDSKILFTLSFIEFKYIFSS